MLKVWKHRPALISSEDLTELEKKIEELEQTVPVELRVVVDNHVPYYPVGGLRSLICALIVIELVLYSLWIWLPFYLFPGLILLCLFIPAGYLGKFPLARTFSTKKEQENSLLVRTEELFETYRVSATNHRNGVLLYLSTFEKKFYLMPDLGARNAWKEKDWSDWTQNLSNALSNRKDPNSLFNGISILVNELRMNAQKLKREQSLVSERLPNHVVVL